MNGIKRLNLEAGKLKISIMILLSFIHSNCYRTFLFYNCRDNQSQDFSDQCKVGSHHGEGTF